MFGLAPRRIVTAEEALPGRASSAFSVPDRHEVLDAPLDGPLPDGFAVAYFGLGCFWGAERIFWQVPGVYSTAVGYQGGSSPHPTYEEACTGRTGHTEAVRVAFDPAKVSYQDLLRVFWESHDPTQGYRQGNDVGTQYRSAIYTTTPEQAEQAAASREVYQQQLRRGGYGDITTEIAAAQPFYFAEAYHQQYLHKNPNGYCGIGGTGVTCPVGLGA